jgi:hypothetical protein
MILSEPFSVACATIVGFAAGVATAAAAGLAAGVGDTARVVAVGGGTVGVDAGAAQADTVKTSAVSADTRTPRRIVYLPYRLLRWIV